MSSDIDRFFWCELLKELSISFDLFACIFSDVDPLLNEINAKVREILADDDECLARHSVRF